MLLLHSFLIVLICLALVNEIGNRENILLTVIRFIIFSAPFILIC